MGSRCEEDIISLINTVAIAEPQHNDAANLQNSIVLLQNDAFKSSLRDLFICGALVILLLFYLPLV